jgi:hypothetical protein
MKKTIYVPVDISERLPTEKGYYNIQTSAFPIACGRGFFNGTKFIFSASSAVGGLLERGDKLLWLKPIEVSDEQILKLIQAKSNYITDRNTVVDDFSFGNLAQDILEAITNK